MEGLKAEKRVRGHGRGGGFFALSQDVWAQLWNAETSNRLNLIITYLVLLAGTGSDHRLTKWSAKACEEHTGLGKPRAKHAIEELIAAGLVTRTDASTRMMPQYQLPELPIEAEPIFLPMALVTGLSDETPVLRRVRETGDPYLLRMLIDLYGLVSLDAVHGIPIENLREGQQDGRPSARKIAELGAHGIWALNSGTYRHAAGPWTLPHYEKASSESGSWGSFWARVDMLKQIGAIWFETWVFDGEALDAEPLMPVDPAGFYSLRSEDDEARLTRLAFEVAHALVTEERTYLFDRNEGDFFLPLTLHRQAPALRRVARMRVEPDTPGRRLAWKNRRTLVEQHLKAFEQLLEDARTENFSRPMRSVPAREPMR